MTRRRVLTLTSTKKKDNMMLYDPVNPTNNFTTLNAGGTVAYLWCPTYRERQAADDESDRKAQTVYMKGLSEKVFLGSSMCEFKWRRIVFETKSFAPADEDVSVVTAPNGYMRLWKRLPAELRTALENTLFDGVEGKDWRNSFTAKVDTNVVKLHFDKTRILRTGALHAHEHNYKDYFPFEKNFTYADEENGSGMDTSGYSARTIGGMGDVFIYDFFVDIGGQIPTEDNPKADTLYIRSESTLYWHEK